MLWWCAVGVVVVVDVAVDAHVVVAVAVADTVDVVVVMLVIMDVMCSLLRTRCECLVIQRVIFHGFHPIDHCGCQDTYKFLI